MLITFPFNSFSQTVDEIIEANLKATGGRERMDSVKSWKIVRMDKNISNVNFITNSVITLWYKAPCKFREETTIKGKKMYFGNDCEILWGKNELDENSIAGTPKFRKINNSNNEDVQKYYKYFKDLIWPYTYNMNKDSLVAEYIGDVDIDGKKCFKIKITYTISHNEYFIFIDKITNLQYKSEYEFTIGAQHIKMESIIAEYQKIEGFYIPRKVIYKENEVIHNEYIFQTVILNPKIADEFFKMPENKIEEN
jgi:hypothetical protein